MKFIVADYKASPLRFIAETIAMSANIGAGIYLAFTAPLPNILVVYAMWLVASLIFIATGISRNSTGIVAMNILFIAINCIGVYRTLF